MNCNDVQEVLPEMMEGSQNGEFQAHLKACPACAELVSDLELIASEARQLAAVDEPAPRVWVNIAAQLRAERIIREPEETPGRPVLVPHTRGRWSAWWLVPVAAALVAAGSYMLNRQPVPQVASQNSTTPSVAATAEKTPVVDEAAKKAGQQIAANKAPKDVRPFGEPADHAPMATVSTEDRQFLNQVGQRSPEMRSAYEGQLQAVNAYIRDAEAYLKQNPGDEETRQQLMDAYEQKSMLYQMALDHVQ